MQGSLHGAIVARATSPEVGRPGGPGERPGRDSPRRLSHPPFILGHMERQLILLEDIATDWRLDDETRRRGRQGVAEARAALVEATRRAAA